MQTLTTIFCAVIAILLQTYLPLRCDLLLVLLVVLSVKRSKSETLLYAFLGGFVLDALSVMGFINTLSKTLAGILANYLKDLFSLEPSFLALLLVLILTPLTYLFEISVLLLFFHQSLGWGQHFIRFAQLMLCNLLLTPIVFMLIKES
jgi:rod shape-determining protein MreD